MIIDHQRAKHYHCTAEKGLFTNPIHPSHPSIHDDATSVANMLLFWCLIPLTFRISSWSAFAPSSILVLWALRILGQLCHDPLVDRPLLVTASAGINHPRCCWDKKHFSPQRRWSEPSNFLRPASLSPHCRWQSSFWRRKKVKSVSQNIWLVCKTDTGRCPHSHWPAETSLIFQPRRVSHVSHAE